MFRVAVAALVLLAPAAAAQPPTTPPKADGKYVKKATRGATAAATLESFGLPTLAGKWYFAGPFDGAFDVPAAPEKGVDLKATYAGKGNAKFGWKEVPNFTLGTVYNLQKLCPDDPKDCGVYLFHEFEAAAAGTLPISLGSDDTLSVFCNGERLLHENHSRAVAPDQAVLTLKVKAGKNQLLIHVGQYAFDWAVYVAPGLPDSIPKAVRDRFVKDFPPPAETPTAVPPAEAKYYVVNTFAPPADCVLEVGGLGFRPDGKLLACTRRGEVWLVANPGAANPADAVFTRFAAGLHESLGLWVQDDKTVFVTQRPELTKLTDRDGNGTADEFETVCDKWGVSGDYHEFAFGPARDKAGNFFITLNVGFGGGHQAKSPWRGWCVKVTPGGEMEPWAYGLRSPNGIAFAPDGELFYTDNQGEWVATNKMHHLKKGGFYGHQAPLLWVKKSAFAANGDKVKSGMLYDGQKGPTGGPAGMPAVDPPCIWFPYGRMGQSVSEPVWDTTGGKFGPFAGQCFVGDQTRSMVMRVALEKVNGVYQGACFPFRSGLQCGVNRLAFGPDGALYVGQTARGWGSVGGKPHGLQRINFAGGTPTEIQTMTVTKAGFDLHFTKPMNAKLAAAVKTYTLKSFTYVYKGDYGCPETDTQAEKLDVLGVSKDGKTVSLAVPGRRPGRVYDLRVNDLTAADGDDLLHPEAYYTLNAVPK